MPATARATSRQRTTLRYVLDEANRLRIRDPREALTPVRVVEGRVTTDAQQRLVYEASQALGPGESPKAVALDGTWGLTPQHALTFALHGSERSPRQTLYLKGGLVRSDAGHLVVALRRGEGPVSATEELSLAGRWQADERNRLTFFVARGQGQEDRLTLRGAWAVGPDHELLYQYREVAARRRTTAIRTLRWSGVWDVPGPNRLAFRVERSNRSTLEFRASLQSPSVRAREGRLAFEVGIGVAARQTVVRRVELFGVWKLQRDLTLSFEVPYADGRRQAVRFTAQAALTPRDDLEVSLATPRGESLGLAVRFSRRVSEHVRWFLQWQKSAEEAGVLGGVTVQF